MPGLFGRGRTLSARLITGVLLLLIGACAVIGAVSYLAIRGSMVSSLDGQPQRTYASHRFAARSPTRRAIAQL